MIQLPKPKVDVRLLPGHKYTINGRAVRGVTTIITLAGMKSIWLCDQYYLDRGTFTHEAMRLYCKGTLDVDSISDGIRGYVQSGISIFEKLGFKNDTIADELSVGSAVYGYAGTLDKLILVDGECEIWDYKTGKPGTKGKNPDGLQLAGYKRGLLETYGIKVKRCRVWYLDGDGGVPKSQVFEGPLEESMFLACVNWINARDIYNPIKEGV